MEDLIAAAQRARTQAYAPYSHYPVGAAVKGADGRVWTGANVENVSYGLAICAERSAVAKMVNDGCQEVREVAVVTKDGGTPCGMCLQVLLEFAPDPGTVNVICASEATGKKEFFTLAELIPHGFRSALA